LGKFHDIELPGEDLIIKGLEDLSKGKESIESLLVLIGAPRLRSLNIDIPKIELTDFPENLLYRMLAKADPISAHRTMNSYIRRLVSFESALEHLRRDSN